MPANLLVHCVWAALEERSILRLASCTSQDEAQQVERSTRRCLHRRNLTNTAWCPCAACALKMVNRVFALTVRPRTGCSANRVSSTVRSGGTRPGCALSEWSNLLVVLVEQGSLAMALSRNTCVDQSCFALTLCGLSLLCATR